MSAIHIATPDGQSAVHDETEARSLLASDSLPPGTLFWQTGMPEWQPIDELLPALDNPVPSSSRPPILSASGPDSFRGPPKTSGLAIASFTCGLASLLIEIFGGLPAIICGHMALGPIRNSGGAIAGRGFAITGLILGYVSVAFTIFIIIGFLFAMGASATY